MDLSTIDGDQPLEIHQVYECLLNDFKLLDWSDSQVVWNAGNMVDDIWLN